ncbi:bifunctional ADP-dependent NAD(P)H-hydrate dehydratase/NAD(P)H-hydrate epimerase [Clostridium cellulovorans]|uniref:Bifunctional NAD(P)H-hydrate repair enzyme n=1 Tax=Clostridium cellulovorans (strain ATCC 35296 / DSM 3052 / OCM 3 / 743B) TaxID=573061 RepID=D9SW80_CLOC7|nr:bifunctional ADP-dependent NAD(P)H-hydrate dehydratase/NAD(P)H-hydrate epimerase [Clostridium cellulovorans]ADL51224.1 carbohydrate kinase, YjeF related protein [Clostridium cellulovorans 743B]
MRIGTSKMTGEVDKACVDKLEIPLMVLMENAALKVVKHLEIDKYSSYVVVCATGNNGGDGLAAARHLSALGKKVEIFVVLNDNRNMSECFKANYNILKNMGTVINEVTSIESLQKLKASILDSEVTIDAIFGTGLNREVQWLFKQAITIVTDYSNYIVSIDIPSGMNGDNGNILGICVRAHKTICFEFYKRGFLNYGTEEFTGEIIVEPIGISQNILDQFHNNEFILEKADVINNIKPRQKQGHKGTYGRTLILAGSEGFSGAAYLATQSAVRTGSGLVTLCCNSKIQDILSCKLSEAMTISYENKEKLLELLRVSTAVAIGPGLGNNQETLELLELVLEESKGPIIIDADGLNVLSTNLQLLKKTKAPVIITPHPGEMSRLTEISVKEINSSRVDLAKSFALEHNIIVLLKGYQTIITNGLKVYVNPTGNSAMANGGMGDCLTGIITSLASQGIPAFEAAACGAYIHGYAGDKLSQTMYAVNATRVIEEIPYIMKEFICEK